MKKLFVLLFAMALAAPLFAVNVTINSNAAANCQSVELHKGPDSWPFTASYPTSPQSTTINQGDAGIIINFIGGGALMFTVPNAGLNPLPYGPINVGTINCQGTNYTVYVTIDSAGDIVIDII